MLPLRPLAVVTLAAAGLFSFAADARAGFTTVASRAALAGNDYLDWPSASSGNPVFGDYTLTTFGGLDTDVTAAGSSSVSFGDLGSQFQTLNGFNSIFLNGGGQGGGIVSVLLRFDSAVQAFGADLAAFSSSAGDSQVRVQLFDTSSSFLTSFDLASVPNGAVAFNGFFGVRSDTANIGEVRFVSQTAGFARRPWTARLEVNRVDLVTSGGSANPVPAPPGAVLFAVGALGLLGRAGWGRRVSRNPAAG